MTSHGSFVAFLDRLGGEVLHKSVSKRLAATATAALLVSVCGSSYSAAHELPVGDGHVASRPAKGYVYACRMHFRGGGAYATGAWFHGRTWNPNQKPHVQGNVTWPSARLSVTTSGDSLHIRGNGLPVKQATGRFPISPTDPAFRYDRNPNSIQARSVDLDLPVHPVRARSPGCLPMGMIGVTVTGVAIYSAVDDGGRDAAAHEIQDRCDGHPERTGRYHYHSASPCLPGARNNRLVGWALDGYPIFGMRDKRGKTLTNSDLDACHGRAETVKVGRLTYDYAYRLTAEYPYTIGCFVGRR
ncbi:YHYH protein [Jiella sp. M17.18]|uniref:YHYH protein n=1 Tax=Jiella sp. M17.18 TaxID=3234247 RepID=UPI0034DFF0DD